MDNPRFNQLLDHARKRDEASVAQLWHEFGFDFHAEVQASAPQIANPQSTIGNARHPKGGR